MTPLGAQGRFLKAFHDALPGIRAAMGPAWEPFRPKLERILEELENADARAAHELILTLVRELLATPGGERIELMVRQLSTIAEIDLTRPPVVMRGGGASSLGAPLAKLKEGLGLLESVGGGLLGLAGSPPEESRAPPQSEGAEPVDCVVFGPAIARADSTFLLQVWVYPPPAADQVEFRAREADDTASRRAFHALQLQLEAGDPIDVHVEMAGLEIDEPDESFSWSGRPDARQFAVSVPAGTDMPVSIGKVSVSARGVPAGTLRFQVRIEQTPEPQAWEALGCGSVRYQRGFVSYSSADRAEVLRRVQGMRAAGISVFQDVLDLDPGDRWERRLYEEIDECDVFYLFWSSAASESEWVMKEAQYAIERQSRSGDELPEIRPIPIEGPPIPLPPPFSRNLHFNDALLTHISASDRD